MNSAQPRSKARVLIVEDDLGCRELLTDVLEIQGCAVASAASGAEAYRIAADVDPEVVLFDLRLADMTGLECHAHLRQTLEDYSPILVTAHLTRQTAVEAAHIGFRRILEKPFADTGVLARAVENAVEAARLRRENRVLAETLRGRNAALQRSNDELRDALGALGRARKESESLLQALPLPVVAFEDGAAVTSNAAFRSVFGGEVLPRAFISPYELEQLTRCVERDGVCLLNDRGWSGPDGHAVFNVRATRDVEGRILLALSDQNAGLGTRERLERRRRLSALGAASRGLHDGLVDPLTLIGMNLEQMSGHAQTVRGAWDELRGCSRPRNRAEARRWHAADLLMDEVAQMAGECRTAVNRIGEQLSAVQAFTPAPSEGRSSSVDDALRAALTLTRTTRQQICETRVEVEPLGQAEVPASALKQVLVDLLLLAVGSLRGWGLLRLLGAPAGGLVMLLVLVEGEVEDSDATELGETLQRMGGALKMQPDSGGTTFVVHLPRAMS